MKKLLLVFSLLSFSNSFSQTYLPMLELGNVWNTVTYNYPDPVSISNQTYEITGQQTIGSFTYYTVDFSIFNWLLREDNGKVYCYNDSEGIDELLFDFTLEVGDEIFLDSSNQAYCYTIGGVYIDGEPITVSSTSIQFIAGTNRKVIEFQYQGTQVETWIEGIGSLNGIYPYAFTNFDSGAYLSCFTNNGNTHYFNGFTSCAILGMNDIEIDKIKLYPNPVSANALLSIPAHIDIQNIKIFDVFGRLVKDERVDNKSISIDGSVYKSGIYVYQLFSRSKLVKTDKFVVL
ncbi:T9SS type A sorting domain-containing protein [Aequorivita echinoideorum]|uniref:T9SS type A sorting domain-containing protein n=1 Tax=Aequorivita echinoideorum TaxID=1549647 RepID=A0ABS5S6V5_9FLAO|nr:T9SS type A sorting domain-containing protein [Aequorivita echinoideorum]MBT0608919.1 T9SS type A sorting domain-containing protein [Aequorivita echinoideorum]